MLATLAQLKAALGIAEADTSKDALVTTSLTMANALIMGYLGADLSDVVLDRVVAKKVECARHISLPVWPAISITSVTLDGTPMAAADYELEGVIGVLNFVNGTVTGRASVTYKAGYATIPADLNMVCLNIGASIYNNGGNIAGTVSGSGELKSLTMFDAMSMSFETGSGSGDAPAALLREWSFLLNPYRCTAPVMA
jgi:hypothetical protein